ncbi:hypothetical protein LTR36_007530 [Oleoguttula mirabilis]|uniref:Mog1p/PsbP-like protein n=1 Tax=Oleoguttula mirabilis TaxID=1507867 RepID=A0AAV9JWT1_9PEZI|nr:hypothetical protein LTR36_007530 [Oleoguttula mirabilis]
MSAPPDYRTVELFGGAITVALPSTFADVSAIRQVPDHQEVYLDQAGFTSIVVEVLERVEKPDDDALQYHLQDLAEEDVGDVKVWGQGCEPVHFSKLPQGTPAYTLLATSPPGAKQRGRANEPEFVGILLTMIRLVEQKTDLIIAINVPHVAGTYDEAEVDLAGGKYGKLIEAAMGLREKVVETLEIRDWGLFVQGD